MATISSTIELYDNFSGPMRNIQEAVNASTSAVDDLQSTLNNTADAGGMEDIANQAYEGGDAVNQMDAILQQMAQNIEKNTERQEEFNSSLQKGQNYAEKLGSLVKTAISAYTGVAGIRKAVSWIEECTEAFDTQLNAENQLMVVLGNTLDQDYVAQFEIEVTADTSEAVNAINDVSDVADTDVTVSVNAETKALESEFDQITAKAEEIQSNGIYADEGMIAAAAEFATYFSDVDAITMMMDTLSDYAMGMSGGGELSAQELVDYATNLGKITSGSYDAMTKKGFEFSDAQQDIIDGVATQEEIVSVLGEEYLDMSEDMQAAATISQVIEESWDGLYETMSNTPEGKITQLKNSFGDLEETIGGKLYPYIIKFVDAINNNWPAIQGVINGFASAIQVVMGILGNLVDAVLNFATMVQDNWSTIAPIIGGIATALGLYYGAQLAANAISAISTGIHAAMAAAQTIHAAATSMLAGATLTETAAQYGMNTALLACPLTWILVLIIAVVAAIFAVVAAINKATGATTSALGVITGAVNVVIQFFKNLGLGVANIALGIWNVLKACASNLQTAFSNAIGHVQAFFWNLLSDVLTVVGKIAEALNKLPFVNFDYSGLTDAANNYAEKAAEAAQSSEYESISDAWNEGVSTFDAFSDGWVSDAYQSGYSWGEGIQDKISNFSLSDLFNVDDVASAEDYLTDYTGSDYSDLASDVGDIADNSSSIASSLDCTDEELKYLRDIAEQETVNRFTTAEITINQENNNNISSSMDLDGVVAGLTDGVNEAIEIMTEGVHT